MTVRLKKLSEQVIVITGASSGIGLATAKLAVERGAKVVISSRNRAELERLSAELNEGQQGQVLAVECDVADPDAVEALAHKAQSTFGRIDTWINNAGASIYGKLWETPIAEKRRLFDVNFWGVVYGCRSALKVMSKEGGAIINLGSALSDRTIPIQGIYSASKHAVKGYTDALRMEVEAEGWPLSISLVKPAAIDTPYPEHAINHMPDHPVHAPPVYAPEVAARAILECAEHPRRDVFVGGAAKFYSLAETLAPRLTDLLLEHVSMESGQSSKKQGHLPQENSLLEVPKTEGRTRGHYPGRVMKTSAYTKTTMHPGVSVLIAAGLGLVAAAGIGLLTSEKVRTLGSSSFQLPDDVVRH